MIQRRYPPLIYFVRRADGEGPIKIGCSQLPHERLIALAQWAPYPLEILATLPGDESVEKRFHARFAAQFWHHEWFHTSAELEETIRSVAAGTFDIETLPPPKTLHTRVYKPWPVEKREGHGLRRRIDFVLQRTGLQAPETLRDRAGEYEASTVEERESIRADVLAFVADPLATGTVPPWGWAQERHDEWRGRLRKAA